MRFVKPEITRLEFVDSDGEKAWIEVKNELTVGEEKRYRAAAFGRVQAMGGSNGIDIDWECMAFARVDAYLVEWSDKRPLNTDAIRALSSEDFEQIDALIQAHIERRAQEKKVKTGEPTLAAVSA